MRFPTGGIVREPLSTVFVNDMEHESVTCTGIPIPTVTVWMREDDSWSMRVEKSKTCEPIE